MVSSPLPLPEDAFRKCRKNHRGITLFSHKDIPTHGWWENNHRWVILIYRNMNLIMDDEPRSKLNEQHWQLIGLLMIIICKAHIPKNTQKNLVFSMMKVHFIKVDAHQLLWRKLGTEFFFYFANAYSYFCYTILIFSCFE